MRLKNGQEKVEFHVYPVRDFNKHPKQNVTKQQQQRLPHELNIVFLCVDSLSRSSAIRNIPKFYELVRKDPDSIIMKVTYHIDFIELLSRNFFVVVCSRKCKGWDCIPLIWIGPDQIFLSKQ